MSSLAAQLAGIKANNNATILDKSKRKKIHSVSLVYDPREAATQDFESIYYDCLEAFNEMQSVDHRFAAFAKSLFSETSIRFDRLGQNAEQSTALNAAIEQFLMLISSYLHLNPAFRTLEWLVRRFQIQVHNIEALLMAALPWHDTSEFVRVLDIVSSTNLPKIFQFLATSKQNMQGPSKSALVRVITRDGQLLQAFNDFELRAIKHGFVYNRQLVFWTSINIMLAMVYKEEGEFQAATDRLLPVVSDIVVCSNRSQAQIAAYTVLTVCASQFPLSESILEAASETVVAKWTTESCRQGLACLSVLSKSIKSTPFSSATTKKLVDSFGSLDQLVLEIQTLKNGTIAGLVEKLVVSVLIHMPHEFPGMVSLVTSLSSIDMLNHISQHAIANGPFEPNLNSSFVSVIEQCGSSLPLSQIDRLEIALQSSIKVLEREDAMEVDDDGSNNIDDAVEEPKLKVDINEVLEEASNMDQSTQRSFTDAPLPQSDNRAQIWVKAASTGQARLDELRQVARVSPEAQLSFVLAIAIGPWPSIARTMAVRVAAATVNAVLQQDAASADYQNLLPFVLFLLSDRERRVRKEAAQLLRSLTLMRPNSRSPKFETTLGSNASVGELQRQDLQHIIKKLADSAEECVLDPEYVITAARQAGKAAWCEFLANQALQTRLPQILWILLRCLAHFKGVAKQLSPLLKRWNTSESRSLWNQLCKEAKVPLNGLERAIVAAVRSNDPVGIEFLLEGVKSQNIQFAAIAGSQIALIWHEVLRDDTKSAVAGQLVDIATDSKYDFDSREVLGELQPFSASLYAKLLSGGSASSSNHPQLFNETSKRRRRRSSSTVQIRDGPRLEVAAAAERHLSRTTLVLELLERNTNKLFVASNTQSSPSETAKLLATLFDILEELMALGEGSQLPVLYTEELLAGCMIGLVQALKQQKCRASELNSLKVSTLVSCIRTSSSPQVQNRLLLLVAALATLCPDAVLHGVMPIFTFMGANTVRLDNDFSAHVIQQTIEQVIPALVAAGDKHEEIEMALLSFVAAFPHIPRHRRNSLFGALIKTLGSEQSLYKLLLLLAQRYAESVSGRRVADAKALVYFATPFLRSFTPSEQLQAMNSYVQFVRTSDESDSPSNSTSGSGRFGLFKIKDALSSTASGAMRLRNSLYEFLAKTAGERESIAGTQPLRVAMQSSQLQEDEQELPTLMIASLLDECSRHGKDLPAASELLVCTLEVLPIQRFVDVVLPLITANNDRVLELVSKKFSYEPADDEESIAAAKTTVEHLVSLVTSGSTSSLIDTCESVLLRFGTKLRELELKLLEQLAGPAGILSNNRLVVLSSIATIDTVCQHLGAATYGLFPRIFPVLCSKVQSIQHLAAQQPDDNEEMADEEDDEFQLAVFALFGGLVRQMPRFMAPEAPAMFELVLASHTAVSPRLQILKVLEQKLDSRTILTALCQSWPAAMRGGMPGINIFFAALEAAVESVERRELANEMPQFTNLAISCLGTRASSSNNGNNGIDLANQVEARIIECVLAAFMRLNDRVVRPQFRRVVQWGLDGPPQDAKQIACLKFVSRVFAQLKAVVTNYAGYLIDDACSLLDVRTGTSNAAVRKLVFQSLTTSFTYDQDDFWQSPARFDKVCDVLLAQLSLDPQTHGTLVVKSITALAHASSPMHRKRINDGLAQLLSGDSSVSQKIWTIKVFSSLYRRLGEAWMSNLPQLVPLIAELLDDEDESVELETRRSLVPVIEGVLGESLDRYLA